MSFKWKGFVLFFVLSNAQSPLYPEDGSTQLTQSTQQINLPAGVTFPFFGKIYNALYVSKDGLVGFSPQAAYKNTVYSKYQTYYVASNDYPFAAAFHFAAVSLGSVTSAGETYRGVTKYRQILSANEESRNISNFIREAFPGQDTFQATYVLVVTWRDVFDLREQSVVNCQYQNEPNICKTNTFQQVMVTDGTSSFAIFNYLKTDVKTSPTTQSGFNGGNGRGWSEAIKSGSLQTANASQGSDVVGRYVYQIDDTVIYKGGCTPQKSNMDTLYIKQQYAGMFGGKMIDFNGPCLATSSKIKCKFGHNSGERTTTGIMVNSMRGRCLVPTLLERGRVPVSVSVNDGFSYYFSSELTIVHPSRMPSMLSNGKGWNESTSTSLSMSWHPDDLTCVSSALVDVNLVGYKETLVRSSWDNLLTISQGIPVSQGQFAFNVKDALCNDDCSSYEIGFVQIKLHNMSLATSHGFLVSSILPLGFLMNKRMTEKFGANWPHDKCIAWYNKDSMDTSWLTAIPSCPCNLQQAIVDIGNWQPDLGCNLYSKRNGNCLFHQKAVHCVLSVQPTMHNKDGAGNQCCYSQNGLLLFAADTFQGSTPDRSHSWGAYPYVQPNYVPITSHGLHDVISFFYCCLWVDYKDCDYYMDSRPTRDCRNYIPPKQAMVYGLSHVMTFDGSSYRVCGEGDFVLLKSLEMTIEGRFQRSTLLTGTQNKSVILTGVGIKFNAEKVELRLRGSDMDRSQRLVDVLVNDKFVLFDQIPMRWQDFKECAIVNNMDLNNPSTNMESNFTVISHDGIGIQVAVKNDMLELLVVLPPKLKDKVFGLLGNWNDNRSDDFKPNETSSSVQFTDLPTLFSYFQYAWAIKEKKNSILPFTLLAINDSSMCNVPMSGTSYSFCGGNKDCEFDMWETNNRTLALATKSSSERYAEIDSFTQPVRSCGLLDVPRSTKSSNNYTLGSTVTVTDCRVGTLSGDTTYTCTANGEEKQQWSPAVTASCAAQSPLYSEDGSTQLTQSTQQVNMPSGVTFPFFGKIYNALYVSKDGLVGFSPQAAYKNTVYSKYQTQYVASNDYPFAAAFHFAAVSLGSVTSAGETYRGVTKYRQILSANEESRNISNFIRAAFPGQDQFQATYVLVVTWRDVFDLREQSVVNCQYQTGPNICKTNTFQQVMVTDGSSSFAIFNYLKTDVKTSPTTQSGFNGGNGRGWSEAIKSGSLQTANASQGSDVVGRYVYQIDDTVIYKGGCTPQKSNMETLYIKQQYAGMFGGKMIDFNGPCLATNRKIKCKFGHDAGEKTSTGIMINSMRGRCLVPTLLERGRVPVALSINDGFSYYFSSELTIVHPSRMPSMLSYGKGWNETTSTSLSMSWQSDDLTNVSSALVDVTLIGYKETLVRSSWDILLTISQGIRVSQGSFTFNVKDALCNDDCSSYEIGIVQIKLQDMSLATSHGFLVSGILPLGFLMNTRMTEKYGANWPHDKCLAWYNKDSEDTSWLTAIPNCPCNLQQALVDIGSWQADLGCNLFSNRDGNCRFHHEAVHCVRAVQPAMHNKDGAGNQCCYARNGLLLFAADTFQGSTPDRSHDWGASPYVQPNYVPSTSHWLHDVITFYYCCLWVEYNDCDYYMDNRATRDCKNYMPPKQAMVYGLSHVMTFDGSSYRVCGEGDFVLLKSLEMTIEGRFQKSKFLTGTQNKSVILTDVGIKFNTEKVEIRLRGPDVDRSQRLIDVLVSDKFILFDQTPMRWQDFKECAIVNNMDLNNPSSNMESNFTVISHDGIGIQVAVKNNMLELMVVLPPKLKNKVLGLLGDWNGNRSDDFKPNETSSSVQFTDLPTLFSDFQYAWAIKEKKNSIVPFTLLAVNDSSMCNVPMSGTGYGFCGGNKDCEFDMWETNNRTLALATKLSSERYTEIDSFTQPVRSCGLLDVPRSRKSTNNYTLGSTVTVTDCRVGTLSGDTTYTCTANGEEKQQWSPTVTASCADTLEDAQTTLVVAIVVPVVVVFVIIVIIIAVIMKRRSGKNERAANKNVNPEEKESRRNDPPNPINTNSYTYTEVARREDPIVKGGKTASV